MNTTFNRRSVIAGAAGAAALAPLVRGGLVSAQGTPEASPAASPVAETDPYYGELEAAAPSTGPVESLRLGLIPAENFETVVEQFQPFSDYLTETLEVGNLEIFQAINYTSVVEAMRGGNLDLAFFGPFSYILAYELGDARSIAMPGIEGEPSTYTSVIVTTPETGITDLEGIRGSSVAFVDPASTSGNLVPRTILVGAGLEEGAFDETFAGGHDSSLLALANGSVDVACFGRFQIQSAVDEGLIEETDLVILAESDPIPEGPWAVPTSLDISLARRIQDAMFAYASVVGVEIFQSSTGATSSDGYVASPDSLYDPLREIVDVLDLDLEEVGG